MKKIALLYFFLWSLGTIGAQTTTLNSKIDFIGKEVTIEQALNHLKDITQLPISFSNDILPPKKISLVLDNKSVLVVVQKILENTNLTYKIGKEQQVIIIKEPIKPPPKKRFTIKGYLEDAETGEKLIGANIYDQLSGHGTATNEYGYYSLNLEEGKRELVFSYLGYQPYKKKWQLRANKTISISLKSMLVLDEIVVTARDSQLVQSSILHSFSNSLPLETMKALPALMGETDLQRSLQLLPGIQTGTDGVGGLHVRGGSIDQNLYLIDGVPVYNPSHAFGIFSIYNTDVIRNVNLLKGYFPARYSGRLSSVIDVRTKEGNFKSFHGEASLGLVSSKATFEGPIKKDQTSFLVSYRQSFIHTYLKPFSKKFKATQDQTGVLDYRFHDLNIKLNHKFSKADQLYVSFYQGADKLTDETSSFTPAYLLHSVTGDTIAVGKSHFSNNRELNYGNTIAALRYHRMLGQNFFLKANLTYSDYNFQDDYAFSDSLTLAGQVLQKELVLLKNRSGITDFGAKIDVDFVPTPTHFVRFGVHAIQHQFVPGVLALNDDSELGGEEELIEVKISNDSITSNEYNFYIEDEVKLSKHFLINFGAHLSIFQVGAQSYNYMEPRLAAFWNINNKWAARFSVGKMTQFLHLLNRSNIGLTTNLWVSSTEQIAPEEAWQFDVGFDTRIAKGLSLTADFYCKTMKHLIAYTEGANTLTDWENNVTTGGGKSYGGDFSIKKQTVNTTMWLAYSLSWTERTFEKINFGKSYPYRFDRRHHLKLAFVHRFNQKLELTTNWTFGTGLAYTAPTNKYISVIPGLPPEVIINRPAKNNGRMPHYHRLDVGLNFYWMKKWGEYQLRLGAYNAYNRSNPLYFALRNNPTEDNVFHKEFVSVKLLPTMPVASFRIKF